MYGVVVALSLNCPMTLYEELRLMGIGDTRLGKNEPCEITSSPITVVVIVNSVIPDSLG